MPEELLFPQNAATLQMPQTVGRKETPEDATASFWSYHLTIRFVSFNRALANTGENPRRDGHPVDEDGTGLAEPAQDVVADGDNAGNMAFRLPAMVISSTGWAISPFSTQ